MIDFLISLSNAAVLVVPDFYAAGDDDRIAALKARCDEAKPLGLARSDHDEILVIYEGWSSLIDLMIYLISIKKWDAMLPDMENRVAHPDLSAGKAKPLHMHIVVLISYYSVQSLSRSGIYTRAG